MICREYVGKFLPVYLHNKLFIIYHSLSTLFVDSFLLIMNTKDSLSTISNSGAKLISLYYL